MFYALVVAVSVDCAKVIPFAQSLNMHLVNTTIWTQLNTDCCTATGITCVSNRVTAIDFTYLNLNGVLGGDLSTLTSMTDFDVSNNYLTKGISTLFPANVKVFRASNNYLNGSIENWVIPSKITILILSNNRFTGLLPAIPNLMNRYSLSSNQFSGSIPTLPASLWYLYLGSNLLTGNLPILPTALKQMSINYNLLSGKLPIMPDALLAIYLTQNQFSGTLSMLKPQILWIKDNIISGLNISDYTGLFANQCDISNNPLLGKSNLPPTNACVQSGLYSLTSSSILTTSTTSNVPLTSTVAIQLTSTSNPTSSLTSAMGSIATTAVPVNIASSTSSVIADSTSSSMANAVSSSITSQMTSEISSTDTMEPVMTSDSLIISTDMPTSESTTSQTITSSLQHVSYHSTEEIENAIQTVATRVIFRPKLSTTLQTTSLSIQNTTQIHYESKTVAAAYVVSFKAKSMLQISINIMMILRVTVDALVLAYVIGKTPFIKKGKQSQKSSMANTFV
eukprot:NODE_320_length_9849_cov_0.608923.p3 type:complete len:508 gc:universal NODE_320_length_9849_cov_0.608923:1809-286(-)